MSLIRKDTRSQTKEVIFHVYNYFKGLADSDDEVLKNYFRQTQQRTADACGVSCRTVSRVCVEGSSIACQERSSIANSPKQPIRSFTSPRRTYKRMKYATDLGDFENDLIRRTVHAFYERSEYPTLKQIFEVVQQQCNFKGSIASMKRVLVKLKLTKEDWLNSVRHAENISNEDHQKEMHGEVSLISMCDEEDEL